MAGTCSECGIDEKRTLPEAGAAVNRIMIKGSHERLLHLFTKHDLGGGSADCGCVVMDWQFYLCDQHKKK